MELTPKVAAQLADEVYDVKDATRLMLFLGRPEFSKAAADKKLVQAQVGARLVSTKDAFGVCAVGSQSHKNEVFLIFRGSTLSNYGADWVSNARIGLERGNTGLPVHIGFNHIVRSLLPQIKAFLNKHSQVSGPIHCIGHSLGGAVAALVADWVKSVRATPVKLYTFGAPRVGTRGFTRDLTRRLHSPNVYRVYHKNDPVPMIPVFPYVHAPLPGEGYAIPFGQGLLSFAAHGIGQYVDSTRNGSWLSLKAQPNTAWNTRTIEQWLVSDSPDNPADPGVWERVSAALTWVLGKLSAALLAPLQAAVMSGLTLADRIAMALQRGLDLSRHFGFWVYRLMRRLMQLLGMPRVRDVGELTRNLMRWVLTRLIDRMVDQARRAVRQMSGR